MEKHWLTASEIIEENLLSKINLVANVRSGLLTAHEYHTFSPIEWEALERRFNEIKEMCGQQIPGTKRQNKPCTNPYTGRVEISLANVPCQVDPIKILPDEWTDNKGATHHTLPLTLPVLHDFLSRKTRPPVPLSQYEEILSGWGSRQIERVILDSVFLESDILRITKYQQQGEESKTTPQQIKSQNGLLKLIGALVTVNYLEKPGQKYKKSNGSANVSAIATDIQQQIDKIEPKFTLEGLKDRAISDKIKASLDELEKNRI